MSGAAGSLGLKSPITTQLNYEGVNYRKFTAGALDRNGRIRVQNGYNARLYYCAYRIGSRFIAQLEPGEGRLLPIDPNHKFVLISHTATATFPAEAFFACPQV
ncbi:hypothetical protein H4Q26_017638 [Puccinia striiformis f. sp. tritici PST-130]|nr:hypothetical protein H4Q26_017638 [Puccinia striiformis f. sp. tritici PST-130]